MSFANSVRTRTFVAIAIAVLVPALARAQDGKRKTPAALVPHVIAFVDAESTSAESWRGEAAKRGCGITFFTPPEKLDAADRELRALCAKLRQTHPVEGLRFHLAAPVSSVVARYLFEQPGYDIASLVRWGAEAKPSTMADATPPYRLCSYVPTDDLAAIFDCVQRARGMRASKREAGAIATSLDRFHDAAACADIETYFALLAPEAVFLGTDATERWDRDAFRAFATPHFAGESAWVYAPLERHVVLDVDETRASFDEVLGSETYGLCRGSGWLRLVDGRWKIVQYNLTFLVPNELAKGVVSLLRGGSAAEPDAAPVAPTVIYLVRHAEKATTGGNDPELSPAGVERAQRLAAMLRSVRFDALIASEYRRTQLTLRPIAEAQSLTVRTLPAKEVASLAAELRGPLSGRTILVSGHSNTLPQLLAALGVAEPPAIEDEDYTNLFCVSLDRKIARCQRLHY